MTDSLDFCEQVVVTIGVCLGSSVRGADVTCQPPNSTEYFNSLPGIPKLADAFHVWVEIRTEGSNRTELVEESVDNSGNRAVLRLLDNGRETKTIFLYDLNQTFVFRDTNCTVANIISDPSLFVSKAQNASGMTYLPTQLFFNLSAAKVYVGRQEVRGIPCDQWHACVSTPHVNYTVDFYFTVHEWQTPSSSPQVPVRFMVQGNQALDPGSPSLFSRVYDFFGYEPQSVVNEEVFETTKGIVCHGRETMWVIPVLTGEYYHHYRQEAVDVLNNVVRGSEVWFDSKNKFSRMDYNLPDAGPVSEVHDFNFGVRYLRDVGSGQCTPTSLEQEAIDSRLNTQAYLLNGSYVLTIKDPINSFLVDSDFSYSGQRKTRGVMCNVFTSQRSNFDYFNNGSAYTATIEAYFDLLHLNPFRLEVTIPELGVDTIFNIYDYDDRSPDVEVFDVASCFNSSARLDFRVRFADGYYYDYDTEPKISIETNGRSTLASIMQVSLLRVTRFRVEYDESSVYLLASLLDRTPSLAQFTRLANTVIEQNDDSQFADIPSAAACSDLCVNNPEFLCQSFEFCPLDQKPCRLSRSHVSDGGVSVVTSRCDLYSRTINVQGSIEPTIEEAYSNLLNKLFSGDFSIFVTFGADSGIYFPVPAVSSEIMFGHYDDAQLPSLPAKFSYRMEIVYPQESLVNVYDVWYDSPNQLVRIDFRDTVPGPPYYTSYTVSRIHDFTRGIAYDIDTHQGNCTVSPIRSVGDIDVQLLKSSRSGAGIEMVSMKSPSQLFHLDNTYRHTGQKTVRGILCDVFESVRSNLHIGGPDGGVQHPVFQYFFISSDWSYIGDNEDDATVQAPLMLTVTDAEAKVYMIYNFFDFNDEYLTSQNFDISPCFSDNQRIDFVIDFNQTYYPYLATREWDFKEQVQLKLSSLLRISPLRLQDLQVAYNSDQTFLVATLLETVAPQLNFGEDGSTAPYHATKMVPDSDVVSCANVCYNSTSMLCNSFDLCDDKTCLLSTLHVPDGNATGQSGHCRHFSRLTNATYAEPPLERAYAIMKDLVYKGLLSIQIPVPGNESQNATYTAKGIRNDILRSKPPSDTEEGDLHKFTVSDKNMRMREPRLAITGLAVDDCASSCLSEQYFDCEAFSFCYDVGDCFLHDVWPVDHPELLDTSSTCDLYRRLYIDEFIEYPGQILEGAADIVLKASSVEMCARQCFLGPGYPYSCRSFDFCPGTNDCLLRHVHMIDIEPSAVVINSTCTHFSRNHLNDFDKMTNKVLPSLCCDVVYKDVSPLKCAALCLDDLTCQSFEYCTGECHFSSTTAKLNPSMTVSGTCDLYIMQDEAREVDRAPTVTPQAPSSSASPVPAIRSPILSIQTLPRHSALIAISDATDCPQKTVDEDSSNTGPRVGIAFGVLILGMIVGAVSVLLVHRYLIRRVKTDTIELQSGSH
ncbi:uncharacterized protein LOC112573362 isoform X2 [Pomacea canaliculata]|uniref:uncharacterized protein LOC112573362 isoform X2 n=1 Tax=Pomacea canaliculata TaxID=400727 RepID=UPI000D732B68|nr:uncharacterized protein LOC112573362 isoform X2 [Pomacea canaliculata]